MYVRTNNALVNTCEFPLYNCISLPSYGPQSFKHKTLTLNVTFEEDSTESSQYEDKTYKYSIYELII